MKKPFNQDIQFCMWNAAATLCQKIPGVRFAYTESDEITLLLVDYQKAKTEAWFDYRLQKMCSIAACICCNAFNDAAESNMPDHFIKKGPAAFDVRVLQLPADDVENAFLWRQKDAIRNSILSLAQSLFSHKQLQGKRCDTLKKMLKEEKEVTWEDREIYFQRGTSFFKAKKTESSPRGYLVIDKAMPLIIENREYISKWVKPEPEYEVLKETDTLKYWDNLIKGRTV